MIKKAGVKIEHDNSVKKIHFVYAYCFFFIFKPLSSSFLWVFFIKLPNVKNHQNSILCLVIFIMVIL